MSNKDIAPKSRSPLPTLWKGYEGLLIDMQVTIVCVGQRRIATVTDYDVKGVYLHITGFTPIYKTWTAMQGLPIHRIPKRDSTPSTWEDCAWAPYQNQTVSDIDTKA